MVRKSDLPGSEFRAVGVSQEGERERVSEYHLLSPKLHFLKDPIHANFYDITSRTSAAVNLQNLIATKPDNKSQKQTKKKSQNLKP